LQQRGFTEQEYRAHYLAADREQWRFVILLFALPNLGFLWFDLNLYGVGSPDFLRFVILRTALMVYSVWLWWSLPKFGDPQRCDRLMLLWVALGLLVIFVNAYYRPREYFGHYIFEVFAIMAFCTGVPLPLRKHVLVASAYAIPTLLILFLHKLPPIPLYTASVFYVVVLTIISALLLSRRIHGYRHAAYTVLRTAEEQARTDSLTGIANRRAFMDWARTEMARYERTQAPVSVLMLDIDHFKSVNDRFGHDAGDSLLSEFSRRVEAELRAYDQFARLGGEEFVVVLPNCNLADGEAMATRLRKSICEAPFTAGGSPIAMTVSIGVTRVHVGEKQIDDALKRADAALYAAKDKGRNRVEIMP